MIGETDSIIHKENEIWPWVQFINSYVLQAITVVDEERELFGLASFSSWPVSHPCRDVIHVKYALVKI